MIPVALMSLSLVSTQVPLISRSTCSVKLPFFQKAVAVVIIVDSCVILQRKGGIYLKLIEYLSKCPKAVYKKKGGGGGDF